MTPNPKHLTPRELYEKETGWINEFEYSDGWEIYYKSHFGNWLESKLDDAYDRIDELEKENEKYKKLISHLPNDDLLKLVKKELKPLITEHKLRELKNPHNPEI